MGKTLISVTLFRPLFQPKNLGCYPLFNQTCSGVHVPASCCAGNIHLSRLEMGNTSRYMCRIYSNKVWGGHQIYTGDTLLSVIIALLLKLPLVIH